ncbi:hypothetical protein EB796_011402 [Bugula neritina]|uniref:Uncharacterized protein n=1 Tax=Bugula neritina TaxID=10212 RepID=A0A7J7JV65_BUGNE|nr:hypothetical protein EB796_011402 [Bugula neritina]
MLESCSPLEQSKSRKCKPQIRQAQRFWPFTPSDSGSGGGSSCLSDNKVLTNSMTSAANLTDHDTRDFTPDKSPVIAQSPMLSEAGGNASPTLLQTNFIASNSNSDGGESVAESHSHSLPVTSDVMSSQSAPGSSLPSSGKLETELDPVD